MGVDSAANSYLDSLVYSEPRVGSDSDSNSVVGSDLAGVANFVPGTKADSDSGCSTTREYGQPAIS